VAPILLALGITGCCENGNELYCFVRDAEFVTSWASKNPRHNEHISKREFWVRNMVMHEVYPKRRCLSTRLHDVTPQLIVPFNLRSYNGTYECNSKSQGNLWIKRAPPAIAGNWLQPVVTRLWQVSVCTGQRATVSLAEAVTMQTWTLSFPIAPLLDNGLW
jgi:hypothetical protein